MVVGGAYAATDATGRSLCRVFPAGDDCQTP